jgi:hypothetical protein
MVGGPSPSSLAAEGKDRPGSFDYEGVLVRVKKGPARVWLSEAWASGLDGLGATHGPPARRPRAASKTFGPAIA